MGKARKRLELWDFSLLEVGSEGMARHFRLCFLLMYLLLFFLCQNTLAANQEVVLETQNALIKPCASSGPSRLRIWHHQQTNNVMIQLCPGADLESFADVVNLLGGPVLVGRERERGLHFLGNLTPLKGEEKAKIYQVLIRYGRDGGVYPYIRSSFRPPDSTSPGFRYSPEHGGIVLDEIPTFAQDTVVMTSLSVLRNLQRRHLPGILDPSGTQLDIAIGDSYTIEGAWTLNEVEILGPGDPLLSNLRQYGDDGEPFTLEFLPSVFRRPVYTAGLLGSETTLMIEVPLYPEVEDGYSPETRFFPANVHLSLSSLYLIPSLPEEDTVPVSESKSKGSASRGGANRNNMKAEKPRNLGPASHLPIKFPVTAIELLGTQFFIVYTESFDLLVPSSGFQFHSSEPHPTGNWHNGDLKNVQTIPEWVLRHFPEYKSRPVPVISFKRNIEGLGKSGEVFRLLPLEGSRDTLANVGFEPLDWLWTPETIGGASLPIQQTAAFMLKKLERDRGLSCSELMKAHPTSTY